MEPVSAAPYCVPRYLHHRTPGWDPPPRTLGGLTFRKGDSSSRPRNSGKKSPTSSSTAPTRLICLMAPARYVPWLYDRFTCREGDDEDTGYRGNARRAAKGQDQRTRGLDNAAVQNPTVGTHQSGGPGEYRETPQSDPLLELSRTTFTPAPLVRSSQGEVPCSGAPRGSGGELATILFLLRYN